MSLQSAGNGGQRGIERHGWSSLTRASHSLFTLEARERECIVLPCPLCTRVSGCLNYKVTVAKLVVPYRLRRRGLLRVSVWFWQSRWSRWCPMRGRFGCIQRGRSSCSSPAPGGSGRVHVRAR